MAKPVATGGCACTTARISGRNSYIFRCMAISDGPLTPSRDFIALEIDDNQIVDVHHALETPVGVAKMRSASSRIVMLPSLAATQPFWNTRRPDFDDIVAVFALRLDHAGHSIVAK